ncbi:hypothetical protein N7E70_015920 [Aminobacter sp. NyZ550]|uniref:hypothetical protein n=1 Tax=Aminobacter sp. NyZ550 TaxID=2979870 RepID=UPI0021D5CFE7|nr:hypothetical protein [Aminobacter sp. NyZ550]WAX93185.1 hypothetical protein N7E70_015920 [Aminobacter sp. NyZ550]
MTTENFDLFGNPFVVSPTKRGRPPHDVTPKTRNRVSMLVALGWTNPRISAAMGVTLPTLHKHYFYELRQREVARDRLELRRLEMAWDMAEAGNVGAFKEFGKLLERNDRMEVERKMGSDPKSDSKPERPGKKVVDEQRAMDADADLMAELEQEAAQHALHS